MNYHEYLPNKQLKNIIACYWTINFSGNNKGHFNDIILPDGCYDFILNQGSEYFRSDLTTGATTKVSDFAIIGQRKKAVSIQQSCDTNIFAIRFKPNKIKSILNIKPTEIINEIVTCPFLKYNFVHPIKQILDRKTYLLDKINLIEDLLFKKLNSDFSKRSYLDHAISEIIVKNGSMNITKYCSSQQIHKSTLEKAFLNYIGISPKEFSSIIRFNYTCALMNNWGSENLAGVAFESGFFDQAHMCKEFKKFTNASPKGFFSNDYLLPQTGITFQKSLSTYF